MARRRKSIDNDIEDAKGILAILFLLFILFFKKYLSWQLYIVIVIIVIVIIVVVLIYLLKRKRQKFFKEKTTLQELRALTPDQFEEFIADLYQKMGYKAEKVGGAYDGGIDVVAEKNGVKHYIQCKKFITRQAGVHDVRDFYGAMSDKLSNAKGIFITTNIFTTEAEKFAEDKPIELIDGDALIKLVENINGLLVPEAAVEKCPKCGGDLIPRKGKYGQFYGCSNYPKCKFTKNR